MKIRLTILVVLLSSLSLSLLAQSSSYAFKVLVNKGKNEVKSGSSWQPIKVGASLTENDEVKVISNGYLGLVHVSGKPIEVKEAQTYKVADLSRKVSAGVGVITRYTDFILSSNSTNKNNMNATGAVHRGLNNLDVFLPDKPEFAVFYNSKQIINWGVGESKAPYKVSFTSLFGDELKVVETSENSLSLDLDGREFQNEDNVMVRIVSSDGKESEDNLTLKRLSKSDRARIESLLAEIASGVVEENAMTKYYLAGFYEKNNLFIDAATAFQEAIKLAPDVSTFKEEYAAFVLRTGLKEPPVKKD